MSRKFYAPDFLVQAHNLRIAWFDIDKQLTIGDLNQSSMTVEIEKARILDEEIARLENTLVDKRNLRDAHYANIWDNMKRIRAAIKGIYGDDSSQYERVGGTRMSERKPTVRKTAA